MKIGQRSIGPGERAYVIAEIGVNHDGSPARALELTRRAIEAGADAVKFQLFDADLLMSRAAALAAYQASAGETDPRAMLRRLQLGTQDLAPCVDLAHRLGAHAIVTCFSVELVAPAQQLPWDAYKTASPDIIHRPLLTALVRTGKPLIVSTGAATLEEVLRARGWLDEAKDRLCVLQCVSSYPTPLEGAELGGIGALAQALPGIPIGYSDHTGEELTGAMGVSLGACVLEKHFTYSRAAAGPDHGASLEPEGLSRYAHAAHAAVSGPWPESLNRVKRVGERELDVRRVSRQSIVSARALRAGEEITDAVLTFKRPGTGLAPYELASVLGRRAAREIPADVPLTPADLA